MGETLPSLANLTIGCPSTANDDDDGAADRAVLRHRWLPPQKNLTRARPEPKLSAGCHPFTASNDDNEETDSVILNHRWLPQEEDFTGVRQEDLDFLPEAHKAAARQWKVLTDQELRAHFDAAGSPIYSKFSTTIKAHIALLKKLTSDDAVFVDVAGSLGDPEQTVKKLYVPVSNMIRYYFQTKLVKARRMNGKWTYPKNPSVPESWKEAAKRMFRREDEDKLATDDHISDQPEWLPLRISAPPRLGKSAAAMFLISLAWRIGMKVLYSVSPNKLTPILEMIKKFDIVQWPVLSLKQTMSIDGILDFGKEVQKKWRRESGDKEYWWGMHECPVDWFDILFYSSDVHSDAERVADMLDGWANQDVVVLHFHDEAQSFAKIAPGTKGMKGSVSGGKTVLNLRRAYRNTYGLIVNVTATHLPTLYEPLMWGFTGTGLDELPMAKSPEHFESEDYLEPRLRGCSTREYWGDNFDEQLASTFLRTSATKPVAVPMLAPAIRPTESPGYHGIKHLTPWQWRYLPYGHIQADTAPGYDPDNDSGESNEEIFIEHFTEFCDSTKPSKRVQKMSNAPQGETHEYRPMYLAMLARAIKTDRGTFRHVANMCTIVHENDFGDTSFLIFSQLIKKDRLKNWFTYDAMEDIPAAYDEDRDRGLAPNQQRVILIHYNRKDQTRLTGGMPRVACRWFRDAQQAIEFSVSNHNTFRIVIAGYAAMTAGLTLQTVVKSRRRGVAGHVFSWFIPEYIVFARRETAPIDEVMQMIGRTFVDTKKVRPPGGDNHQIQLLSTEGVITNLTTYQIAEDIHNGRIEMPMWLHLNWVMWGFASLGDIWGATSALFLEKAPKKVFLPSAGWFNPVGQVNEMFKKLKTNAKSYLPSTALGLAKTKFEARIVNLISTWEDETRDTTVNPERYEVLCSDVRTSVYRMLFGKRRGKMAELYEQQGAEDEEDEEDDEGEED